MRILTPTVGLRDEGQCWAQKGCLLMFYCDTASLNEVTAGKYGTYLCKMEKKNIHFKNGHLLFILISKLIDILFLHVYQIYIYRYVTHTHTHTH